MDKEYYGNRQLSFVPFDFPKTKDGMYICMLNDGQILESRRNQLRLTQQQVAKIAGVPFAQYQRIEASENGLAGCSMKNGLAICAALLLDPFQMLGIRVNQPSVEDIHHQIIINEIDENIVPKRVGRKHIRRDIMTVYVNYEEYSILIPYDVLRKFGVKDYIQIMWNIPQRRIVLRPATATDESAFDVPAVINENAFLAVPSIIGDQNPIAKMNWGTQAHSVESRLVSTDKGEIALLIDLNTATPSGSIDGIMVTPNYFTGDDDIWDDGDDDIDE